jgi:hypothetical protein
VSSDAVEREVERGNDLARKLNAAEGELERVERELRIVERGLSPLCPCSSGGPNCEGPLQECPFHGDQDMFVAEVQELRERDRLLRHYLRKIAYVIGQPTTATLDHEGDIEELGERVLAELERTATVNSELTVHKEAR